MYAGAIVGVKVVFRVDASNAIGIGHIMRCLTLAETLVNSDVQICFICREHSGNLIALLNKKAFSVTALPAPAIGKCPSGENYSNWLGVTQETDAMQTIEALNGETPDWLVVDHYGLDVDWEQRLHPWVNSMMVIDDLANRHHACDVLLDQSFFIEGKHDYAGFVAATCKLLLGPRYALLKSVYADYRKTLPAHRGQVKRVLIFFGGSDQPNMTGMSLEALSYPELMHLEVDVIVGANNQHRKVVERQVSRRPNTYLHNFRSHLADLMFQADLALGAGGTTTWERMCLGLPSVIISIAENQRHGAELIAAEHLVHFLGDSSDVDAEKISRSILGLITDTKWLRKVSNRNRALVDGLGSLRVRETISPTDVEKIHLRVASIEDIESYFYWANDPEVRKNAFNTDPISWEIHKEWFAEKLDSSGSKLYVLMAGELPVGQIRFEKEGDDEKIHYSLDKLVRGRGWGSKIISLGLETLGKVKPIRLLAEVRIENQASRSVFSRLGFSEIKGKGDYLIFRCDYQ